MTGHILVIDDDATVRKTIHNVLVAGGYLVISANDGNEGLKE